MMTIEEIRERLQGRNHSEVAREVGVTRSYIHYLASGERASPSYAMLARLSEALKDDDRIKEAMREQEASEGMRHE